MEKLISAIITTHNRLELLKRAIDSVLSQTYTNIECVVVSDNSSDGTNEYCSRLPNVKLTVISKEDSRGGNHARNVGVNASHGEYVAFLDDDDYWLPEKIEKQVELMEESNAVLVSCGRLIERVLENSVIEMVDGGCASLPSNDMSKKILYNICTLTSLIMVRRDDLINAGMFDEELSAWQEYEMTIRMAQLGQFRCVNDALAVYRINVGDKARVTNKFYTWKKSVFYIYHKHRGLYKELSFAEKLQVKHLFYSDGYNRARNKGLLMIAFVYKSLCKMYRRTTKLLNWMGIK